MKKNIIVPVILCGGSGTRLWPASREKHPKQFLSLTNDLSLLQNTMCRALRTCDADASSVVVVTLAAMEDAVIRDLSELDPAATSHILCEPGARNTAAAVAFAADYVAKTFGEEAIMWILPADHHISNEDALRAAFEHALVSAKDGHLVTFGITPTRPDTGYGYIRAGAANYTGHVYAVKKFVEKPNLETAKSYLESGEYLWNSGMFVFTAEAVLEQYNIFARNILASARNAAHENAKSPNKEIYMKIESKPFDKAIVEKSTNVAVVPCNPEWSDIGSWESLWEMREKDTNNNVVDGRAACHESTGCLIQGKDRLIAVAGLNDIVVIETDDAILIANKSNGDAMKTLVKGLKDAGASETIDHPVAAAQPWSMVQSIQQSENTLNAHEFTLKPGESLSFAGQAPESCLYTILEGHAKLTKNGSATTLEAMDSAQVEYGISYSIANTGTSDLRMIEVRKGKTEGIFFGVQSNEDTIKKPVKQHTK